MTAWLALLGLVIVAVSAGHEGWRTVQLLMLALPALVWLRWPLHNPRWRTARGVIVGGTLALFVVDGVLRAYLQARYRAQPDSAVVLSAVANTSLREAIEYAGGPVLWLAMVATLSAVGLSTMLVLRCSRQTVVPGRWQRWGLLVLLVLCTLAYLSKPWRRHHPLLFWPAWVSSASGLREGWSDQTQQREQLLANARAAAPRVTQPDPSTVVLVLTDSVNRDNMGLYGYPRDTTPELQVLARQEGDRWLTLRHAWSVRPDTLGSLSGIFSFGAREPGDPVGDGHHLLAVARASGYRIWWMSNHDDLAIDQKHAQLADVVEMINRAPGRATARLDGDLLHGLSVALRDPHPRKLIVVHLLGAHPHYRLRAPATMRPFDAGDDLVEVQMVREGRPMWLRELRQTYDAAIRYHDGVVAQTLRLTRQHVPDGGRAAWMFLSDHGQEVGHDIVHAGHSPGTAAGYRIPAIVWHSGRGFPREIGNRPFRADWAAWTLTDLMGVRWRAQNPQRNVLDPSYRWEAPHLPVGEVQFER